MIKLIKQYRLAAAIVIPVIIFIIIRSTGTGRFRYDTGKWARPSYSGLNLITPEKIADLEGDVLVVVFDKESMKFNPVKGSILQVPSDSVLTTGYRETIAVNKGPVLLYSSDYSLTSRIWMALSQSGFKNVYILAGDTSDESGKEKFRPDTVFKPEF